jgi:hypothetical protein
MSKAIICEWECVSCGNVLENRQVLSTNQKKTKYSFEPIKRCGCGAKENFKLLKFVPATAIIEPDRVD